MNSQEDEDILSDDSFEIEELSDTEEEENNDLDDASGVQVPYCLESDLLPQPSSTPAGATGANAVGEAPGAETVEQAPRKRRTIGTPNAASAQAHQQQRYLSADLAAAEQTLPASKRARFSPELQIAGAVQHTPPAAAARANSPQAAAVAAAAVAGAAGDVSVNFPAKRSQRKLAQGTPHKQPHHHQKPEQQGHKQTLMSPPPPRQARQRPKRHPQSPDLTAKQRQQHLASPHKHSTRAVSRAAAGATAAAPGSPGLSGLSGLAAASSTAAASAAGDTAAGDDESEAICLRTRSKHPIAEQEFDPDVFDRLLAEFDPDLEPLLDEEMYQQFLQTLQEGEGSYGAILGDQTAPATAGNQNAGATTSTAAAPPPALPPGTQPALSSAHPMQGAYSTAAAPAGVLAGSGMQQQQQQQLSQPPLLPSFMGKFSVDDEDDEEFMLDPLDWLLDDEADVAEEEKLLRLVGPSGDGHLSDLGDLGTQDEGGGTTAAAAAAAATSRRRTQREAARRAAERIAAKQQQQQQQWMLEQQQQQQMMLQGQVPGATPGTGVAGVLLQQQMHQPAVLQPLIPATAAGDVQQQQQLSTVPAAAAGAAQPHALTNGAGQVEGGAWEVPGSWQAPVDPLSGHVQGVDSMQDMLQQQQMHDATAGLHGMWDLAGLQAQQQRQQVAMQDAASAAVLTIRAEQLQQLYQQVALHTQLLTQLYAMTALDPSPVSQALASSAGQMLEQIRRLHTESTASVRGQQLGQLVQHAFSDPAGSSREQVPGGGVSGAMQRLRGHQPGLVWRPPVTNIQTIWDTYALRQLDHVVQKLQVVPAPEQSVVDLMLDRAEGAVSARGRPGRSKRSDSSASNKQVEAYMSQLLHSVLGSIKPSLDSVAWPRMTLAQRRNWTPAEDSLLWLGIIRFTSALTPFDLVTACISTELLPARPAATIKKRFTNLITRQDSMAELIMSFALIDDEGPATWQAAPEHPGRPSAAAAAAAAPGLGCLSLQPASAPASTAAGAAGAAAAAAAAVAPSRSGSVEPGAASEAFEWEQARGSGRSISGSRTRQISSSGRGRSRGPIWAAAELGAALTAAFAVEEFGSSLPSAAAAAAASALLGTGSTEAALLPAAAAAADDAVAAAVGLPAALTMGKKLLFDLVSEVTAKLPMLLPCPIEVPSTASLRRRGCSDALAARTAGQQMLMSLAARHILDAPLSEMMGFAAGPGAGGEDAGHEQGSGLGAAAAAATAAHEAAGGAPGSLSLQQQQQAASGSLVAMLMQQPQLAQSAEQLDGGPAGSGPAASTAPTKTRKPPGSAASADADAAWEDSAAAAAEAAAGEDLETMADEAVQKEQEPFQQQEQRQCQQQQQPQVQQAPSEHAAVAAGRATSPAAAAAATGSDGGGGGGAADHCLLQPQRAEGGSRLSDDHHQHHHQQQQRQQQQQADGAVLLQQDGAADAMQAAGNGLPSQGLPIDVVPTRSAAAQPAAAQPAAEKGQAQRNEAGTAAQRAAREGQVQHTESCATAELEGVQAQQGHSAHGHVGDDSAGQCLPVQGEHELAHEQTQQQQVQQQKRWWQLPKVQQQQQRAQSAPAAPPDAAAQQAHAAGLASLQEHHGNGHPQSHQHQQHADQQQPCKLGASKAKKQQQQQQQGRQQSAPAGLQQLRPRALTSAQLAEQLRSAARQQEDAERARQKRARREAAQQRKRARQQQQEQEGTEEGSGSDSGHTDGEAEADIVVGDTAVGVSDMEVEEAAADGGLQQARERVQEPDTAREPQELGRRPMRKAAAAAAAAIASSAAAAEGQPDTATAAGCVKQAVAPGSCDAHQQQQQQQPVPAPALLAAVQPGSQFAGSAALAATALGGRAVGHNAGPQPLQGSFATGQPAIQASYQQTGLRQQPLSQLQHGAGLLLQQQVAPAAQGPSTAAAVPRRPRPTTQVVRSGLPSRGRSSPRPFGATNLSHRSLQSSNEQPRTVSAGVALAFVASALPSAVVNGENGSGSGGARLRGAGVGGLTAAGGCSIGPISMMAGNPQVRRKPLPAAAAGMLHCTTTGLLSPRNHMSGSGNGGSSGVVRSTTAAAGNAKANCSIGQQAQHQQQTLPAASAANAPAAAAAGASGGTAAGTILSSVNQQQPLQQTPGSVRRLQTTLTAGVLGQTPKTQPRHVGPLPGSAAAAAAAAAAGGSTPWYGTPKQPSVRSAPGLMHNQQQQQWQQQLMWQRLQLWHQRQQQPDPLVPAETKLTAAAAATPGVAPSGGWLVEGESIEKKERLRRSLFGKGKKGSGSAAAAAGGGGGGEGSVSGKTASLVSGPVFSTGTGDSGGRQGTGPQQRAQGRVESSADEVVAARLLLEAQLGRQQQEQQQGQRSGRVSAQKAGASSLQQQQQQRSQSKLAAAVMALGAGQQHANTPRKQQQQQQQQRRSSRRQPRASDSGGASYPGGLDVLATAAAAEADWSDQ